MVPAALTLLFALVLDRCFGDPHTPFHPVALFGRFVGWWGRPTHYPKHLQRVVGVVLWTVSVLLFAFPFWLAESYLPPLVLLVLSPFLLKVTFAWRSLEEHASAVETALSSGGLEEGRRAAGMLVSRDTAALGAEEIRSAAYESVAENLSDSVVAPLFWFVVFTPFGLGLTAAAVYRAVNCMDAMLGYPDERIRLGWWPARADDLANLVPSRLTALVGLVYFGVKGRFAPALQTLQADRRKRPGPNGGWPMGVIAGGTGVRFVKPWIYTIGPGERSLLDGGPEIIGAVRGITLGFCSFAIIALFLLG
ncbi:cobalamin biosynthesis protein CobD [Methanofollis formosanus]|uniref:Probable cobalamin biosynthesis protein CobD n=1 Tax=Methanofollis formosanus TaxID=299308 RepID=A0A8G1A294_9EURY|nr:adenosylcobinamide-phosphate synthase CbiB [Methanofollis formosanus]QYZ79373.1 cobalamin biosynthesis protein CobD [Methanofollis formosanus]